MLFFYKKGVDNINENLKVYKGVIKQYLDTKANHKDELLLFQIGNFYVSFFTDALIMSNLASLKITKYGKHNIHKSGFPISSLEKYEVILKENQCSYVIYSETLETTKLNTLKVRKFFKINKLEKTPNDFNIKEKDSVVVSDIQNIVKFIKHLNISNITPVEALNILYKLKNEIDI